jgi:hypothetical protein
MSWDRQDGYRWLILSYNKNQEKQMDFFWASVTFSSTLKKKLFYIAAKL